MDTYQSQTEYHARHRFLQTIKWALLVLAAACIPKSSTAVNRCPVVLIRTFLGGCSVIQNFLEFWGKQRNLLENVQTSGIQISIYQIIVSQGPTVFWNNSNKSKFSTG
jgi:hypothetical protein